MTSDAYPGPEAEAAIELRVDRIAQIFDPLDPFPIPSRDLGKHAEDFIVAWARELPRAASIRIVLHTVASEAASDAARDVATAFQRHFAYRADRVAGDIKEMFRIGRASLAIGLGVLALCVVAGRAVSAVGGGYLGRAVEEGFIIVGWVANWRPIEIFLYDWWPLARLQQLYRRLAAARVEVASTISASH